MCIGNPDRDFLALPVVRKGIMKDNSSNVFLLVNCITGRLALFSVQEPTLLQLLTQLGFILPSDVLVALVTEGHFLLSL